MIHIEQQLQYGKPTKLLVSYWDSNGKRRGASFKIPQSELFEWRETESGGIKNFKSAYGSEVYKSPLKEGKKLSKYRVYELLSQLPEKAGAAIHTQNMPNKTFFDIETESGGDFPNADNPQYPVLSNAFVTNERVVLMGMVDLSVTDIRDMESRLNNHFSTLTEKHLLPNKPYKIEYFRYDTEEELIKAIFNYMRDNVDMLFGWNSLKFDQRYLANRSITMNGIDLDGVPQRDRDYSFMEKHASPTKSSFTLRLVDKFAKNQEKISVPNPTHIPSLDYMELYDKFDFSLKTYMKLDVVASNLLNGIKKLSYSGSLQDFYEKDPKGFLLYNIIDTVLVQLIDAKVDVFSTPLALSKLVKVPIHDTLFAGIMCDKMFADRYYKNGKVFIDKFSTHEKTSYKGGFVLEPKKGMVHDVMIHDFTSMFPSGMMAFNYGIDTLIGKTPDRKVFYDKSGNEHKIDLNKHIISPNGVIYTKEHGDSTLRTMVFELFNGRVQRKVWSKECMAEAVELEHKGHITNGKHYNQNHSGDIKQEIQRLKQLSEKYANESNAMKIIMNSIYGVLGWTRFGLYDVDVASSITAQSRDLIKYTINKFNEYFRKHWKHDVEAHKSLGISLIGDYDYDEDVVVYADTDSVFSAMTKIIDNTDLSNKDNWEVRRDFMLKLQEKVISPYVKEFLCEYAKECGAFTHKPDGEDSFKLGLEQINLSILFVKKKKYIKNTIWSEGSFYKPLEKINPKGVEMNQPSKPKFIRDKLRQVVKVIMSQDTNFSMKEITKEVKKVKEEFLRADIPQLSEVVRVNNIDKHVVSDNPLVMASGTPMNARAAARYNHMLKIDKEMARYKRITNGDKIAMFLTKSATKKPGVFGYPVNEGLPHKHPEINEKAQFEKMILTPINNILSVIDEAEKLNYELITFNGGLEW